MAPKTGKTTSKLLKTATSRRTISSKTLEIVLKSVSEKKFPTPPHATGRPSLEQIDPLKPNRVDPNRPEDSRKDPKNLKKAERT